MSIIQCNNEGRLFIVSAPAGTGKTTLIKRLVTEFPSIIASISYTTRSPRVGEKEGVDYFFISKEAFEQKIATSDFLEYVTLYGTYYGTSIDWVSKQQKTGKHVVLVIDTQGALQVRKKVPVVTIFVCPPSLEVLRKRLTQRETETAEEITKRIKWAESELERACDYDYLLTNDNLDDAYRVLSSIFIAEAHKNSMCGKDIHG